MASRVIRGDIVSSRSLSRVSWQADWLFHKLILAADDFGRMDGRPALIRAQCMPLRDVPLADIEAWLVELESCDGSGKGPVLRYEMDGSPYLQLVNWEKYFSKQKRAARSQFPAPPGVEDPELTPCVYFIQRGDGGPIKIGTTTGLEERLRSLKTAVPNLVVLRVIEGADRSLEKRLHRQFEAERVDGEWFRPSPGLLDWIAGNDGQCPPLPGPARASPGSLDTSRGVGSGVGDEEREKKPQAAPARSRRSPRKAEAPKVGQQAVATYCEEFEAARSAKAAVSPHDARALKDLVILNALDDARVRLAARVFFADEDPWLKKVSYSLRAFVDRFQQCDVRAQKQAELAPFRVDTSGPSPADEMTAEEASAVGSLFGASKGF